MPMFRILTIDLAFLLSRASILMRPNEWIMLSTQIGASYGIFVDLCQKA